MTDDSHATDDLDALAGLDEEDLSVDRYFEPPFQEMPRPEGQAVLLDRFEIDFSRPLPALDSPNAKAYKVKDNRGTHTNIYALMTRPDLPYRAMALRNMAGHGDESLLDLISAGVVETKGGLPVNIIVIERPRGGRVIPLGVDKWDPIPTEMMMHTIIPAMINGIAGLNHMGLVHRSIRPDNLFYADAERQNVVVGECVTEPPAFSQPYCYEPLEHSMSLRSGRGEGDRSCDLFAMGVTIVALLKGQHPYSNKTSPEEVLRMRLARGSYRALTGGTRFASSLGDLVQGLLHDIPEERWSLQTVKEWRSGQAARPPRGMPDRRAPEPFRLGGKEYYQGRLLARAVAEHPNDVNKALSTQGLEMWVRRSLAMPEVADKVEEIRSGADLSNKNPTYRQELATRLAATIDPSAPLRYRGIALFPDGIGPVLARAYLSEDWERVNAVAEMFTGRAISSWVAAQEARSALHMSDEIYVKIRSHLRENTLGRGLERALYELNPGLPCQSPLVKAFNVLTLARLMEVLDMVAEKAEDDAVLVDRHIAAFAASRNRQADTEIRAYVSAGVDEVERNLAMLRFLSVLQRRAGNAPLPNLTALMAGRMAPVIRTFKSKTRRQLLVSKLKGIIKQGILDDLLNLVGSQEIRDADDEGYEMAIGEYQELEAEVLGYRHGSKELERAAVHYGYGLAESISWVALTASAVASWVML